MKTERVIVFGRYPVIGETKTRLIPALGPIGAAELQRKLTEKTLTCVRTTGLERPLDIEFCVEKGSPAQVGRWLGSGLLISHQAAGDLGDRMQRAFLDAFEDGARRVLLLGTDVPGLTPGHINRAFEALSTHELILGPSTDGGYWLIGMKRCLPIFRGMHWGTPTVLDETLAAARSGRWSTYLLDPLTDLDTPEDLKNLMREPAGVRPYASVIIPALNESANVTSTIERALRKESELILVDGGSTDNTVESAKRAGARVLKGPKNRGAQQNCGASKALGDVLLFLHADTLLPSDYMERMFDAFMDTGTIAGAFAFKTDLDRPIMRLVERMTNLRSRFFHLPYGDQGLFIRRRTFSVLGGFPEVPVAEDLLFIRRLKKQGKIHIAPSAAVTSARRWRSLGVCRTALINQIILLGCLLGVPAHMLAPLYAVKNPDARRPIRPAK